jgi:uncharacterized protein YecE (DUF72 family)
MPRPRIGCSGWEYGHWRGNFYPEEVARGRWLEHYARTFDTVEINASFYRLPAASSFERWAARVPARFVFAVKASRFLTHMKKLKEPAGPLQLFFERAAPLAARFGPVLYQLPPRWRANAGRLRAFLDHLPENRLHAIEFRDPTWYTEEILGLLQRRGVTLCLHDMTGSATGLRRVGTFAYLRFHGPGPAYSGGYPEHQLRPCADWIRAEARDGRAVFAYFNNDIGGHAPRDAVRLRQLVND